MKTTLVILLSLAATLNCRADATVWNRSPVSDDQSTVRGSITATIQTIDLSSSPIGPGFDGENIWVALNLSDSVAKVRASDGVVLATYPASDDPRELVYDGGNIWAAMKSMTV